MRDTVSQNLEEGADGLAYNPGRLLDALAELLQVKNDRALAKALEVPAPTLSRIRCRRTPVSANMLIRMHETTDLTVADLRYLMGDRRKKFRLGHAQGKPKK